MLEENEKWYESRGVWGGIVGLVAMAGGYFGYQVSPDDQEALVVLIMGLAGSVGSATAIYGRIKASKKIE